VESQEVEFKTSSSLLTSNDVFLLFYSYDFIPSSVAGGYDAVWILVLSPTSTNSRIPSPSFETFEKSENPVQSNNDVPEPVSRVESFLRDYKEMKVRPLSRVYGLESVEGRVVDEDGVRKHLVGEVERLEEACGE
jgi:hypothetical protein